MTDAKKLNITFSRGDTVIEAPRCTSFPAKGWKVQI